MGRSLDSPFPIEYNKRRKQIGERNGMSARLPCRRRKEGHDMIHNRWRIPPRKLLSEPRIIAGPDGEKSAYAHHPFITWFHGRYYVIWSGGFRNEDDCGQRVMMSRSADGIRWETPFPAVEPFSCGGPDRVLTACGFYTDGEKLTAYVGVYRYRPSLVVKDPAYPVGRRPFEDAGHLDTALYYVTTDDGECWTAPAPVGLSMVANHSPVTVSSGRLIIPGNIMFPYSDEKDGHSGFRTAGIYGDYFKGKPPVDDSESIRAVTKARGWNASLICEGSLYEIGGLLRMLLRSNSGTLWCAESRDNGATWGDPYPTEFTDCGSKFRCGRLPDGRYYCVSNPEPGARLPLTISLSEDGEAFDIAYVLRDEPCAMRFPGFGKGGVYAYPDVLIRDGSLFIVYSVQKESIGITRVPLSALA